MVVAHDRAADLESVDRLLDKDLSSSVIEKRIFARFVELFLVFDKMHAVTASRIARLDDPRQRDLLLDLRERRLRLPLFQTYIIRARDPRLITQDMHDFLVHAHGARKDIAAYIVDVHHFAHALQRAVLAVLAMEDREDDIERNKDLLIQIVYPFMHPGAAVHILLLFPFIVLDGFDRPVVNKEMTGLVDRDPCHIVLFGMDLVQKASSRMQGNRILAALSAKHNS